MRYIPVYKCRLCGEIIKYDFTIEFGSLSDALLATHEKQKALLLGEMSVVHSCLNGNYGVCDLQGHEMVDKIDL